ncbi:hypothetical protein GBA52_029019 [Prunus armeniaca]|nr:hypothetical protein GBA52_029019 [Prunus armeniaca]
MTPPQILDLGRKLFRASQVEWVPHWARAVSILNALFFPPSLGLGFTAGVALSIIGQIKSIPTQLNHQSNSTFRGALIVPNIVYEGSQ